jgi:hypothetical protein
MLVLVFMFILQTGTPVPSVAAAAKKYVPDVEWQPKTVIAADFSCRGRKEQAILGTNSADIVIAVFLNGTTQKPEVLRYSAKVRNASSAELTVEDLNFDPKDVIGVDLPGFKRSSTCKGLNLSDGRSDSAHIYWNHEDRMFDDWVP